MQNCRISKIFTLGILFFLPFLLNAQTTISGKVIDQELSLPLVGANLLIQGTIDGASTDIDGNFTLTSTQALPWTVDVSYTGYELQIIVIDELSTDLSIALKAAFLLGQEVIVSASRRQEKIQDAPASVSVLGERQLSVSAQIAPERNLITVPGIQIQQQTAGRLNISMRGQANLFDTDIFPIMDYRTLLAPGIGLFVSGGVGISNVDLQRIEIVRGPGGALYGPAVTAGVIHFITKNPIDYPGTTVELNGGEGNTFGFFARHAGRSSNGKFGYKINAQYNRGDEFQLDLVEDADQIAKLKNTVVVPVITNGVVDVSQPGEQILGPEDTDPDGDGNPIQDYYRSASFNGTLEFRPQDDFNITISGGFNDGSGLYYTAQGEGHLQGSDFWTQARVQKGGLFAQIFYADSDGGINVKRPTFLYQTGFLGGIATQQIEGQIQYNFDVPTLLNANFTVGVDSRNARADSGHLIYGRNEEDDDYNIFGGYVQGKFKLSDQWDMVLAGRYDEYNFNNEGSFTPRVAFVYKPSPQHTFRASYNKATRPPHALDINLDFPLATPVPGLFDLWTVGTKKAHTFPDPVIDVTIPGVPDLPINTPGLPLAIPFAFVNEAVIPGIVSALEGDPTLAPLIPIITAYLRDPANTPQGFTGTLNAYNIFDGKPFGELIPTESAQLATYSSYDFGYKGLLKNKLSVLVDVYYLKRKGFTLFDAVGPTYSLTGADIATDLGNAIETGITPTLTEALTPSLGANAAATAAILAAQIGGGYSAGGAGAQAQLEPLFGIFGTVESDLIPQGDGISHVAVGYRSDSDLSIDYWGAELALEYYWNESLSIYGNYSWKSKVHWGPGGTGEYDGELPFVITLTVPKHKYRLGLIYSTDTGFFGSLSFQHDNEFFGQIGQFQGLTGGTDIFDGALGYTFNDNFKVTLAATNLFNTEYRAFVKFPVIKRRAVVKVLYNIPHKKAAE